MSLLAPLLAAFAAAIAIPIVIHLLNRTRFRPMAWAAMALLRRSMRQEQSRLRLRDLLLLILRCAAIILAAFALARPLLGGWAAGDGATVVVLDTSLTMGASEGGRTVLEHAREQAARILGEAHGRRALVLAADRATVAGGGMSEDPGPLLAALDEVRIADGGTRLADGVAQARQLLAGSGGGARIVVVGDLQRSAWPSDGDPAWAETLRTLADEGISLAVVDAARRPPANAVAVTAAELADPLVAADRPTEVVATIANHGSEATAGIGVDLLVARIDGSEERVAAQAAIPMLPPGDTATLRLPLRLAEPGTWRVTVRTTPDALPGDNQRRLVVRAQARIPVLLVDGGPGSDGRWNAGDFLAAALGGERSPLEVVRLRADQAAGADLSRYAVIVVADAGSAGGALAPAVAARVEAGAGCLLLPGSADRPDAWNAAWSRLAPAPLARSAAAPEGGQGLLAEGLDHPAVAFFAEPERRAMWSSPRLRQRWELGAAVEGTTVVARFADRQPYLLERIHGRGPVLMAAAPPDRSWGDLPLRAGFVIATIRAVQHLAVPDGGVLALRTGDAAALVVPARLARATITAAGPGGEESVAPVPGPDGRLRATVAATTRSGFIAVRADDEVLAAWALNPPAEESDTVRWDPQALAAALGPAGAGVVTGGEQALAGREIWPWLLGLALACLIAEMWLAQHWAPRAAPQARGEA